MNNSKNNWLSHSIIAAVIIVLLDIAELCHSSNILRFGIHAICLEMILIIFLAFAAYWILRFCVVMPVMRSSKSVSSDFGFGLWVFLIIEYAFYLIHRHVDFGGVFSDLRLLMLVIAATIISVAASSIIVKRTKNLRQRKWIWPLRVICAGVCAIFVVAVGVAAIVTCPSGVSNVEPKPPVQLAGAPKHVILIVIDALRGDGVSCVNQNTRPTPNIDAVAAEGVLFTNAMSQCPWTVPSVASILTGVSPLTHQTLTIKSQLPNECNTIAEYFSEQNYVTTCLYQNTNLNNKNFQQGFDTYEYLASPHVLLHQKLYLIWDTGKFDITTKPHRLTDKAIEWVDRNVDRYGLLYMHYIDPHSPYTPSDEYMPEGKVLPRIGKSFETKDFYAVRQGKVLSDVEKLWVRKLYEAEIAEVDQNIGVFIQHLKERGVYDDSLIIITSDHGDEFWEHDSVDHGHTLYAELLHVPLIVKMPSQTFGTVIDSRVTTSSIVPTVLDICGIEYDPKSFKAVSLEQEIVNREQPDSVNVVATGLLYYENCISVQFDHYKYIEQMDNGTQELYDLSADPEELFNIANDNDKLLSRAQNIIEQAREKSFRIRKSQNYQRMDEVQIDRANLEMLRGLGYVQ